MRISLAQVPIIGKAPGLGPGLGTARVTGRGPSLMSSRPPGTLSAPSRFGHDGHMRFRSWISGLAALALSLGAFGSVANAGTVTTIRAASPCAAPGTPHYSHVVWIMLENTGYSVIGSRQAPYLNRLASACGLATKDYAVSHPSLPNYVALTSGSTQGITDDGDPSAHPLSAPSIFSQLGSDWRVLAESMPRSCDHVTSGDYAARHNPAVYFPALNSICQHNDVPLKLPLDLSARFTFIVPNICNDMHSCPVSAGDAWLSRMIPKIITSSQYQSRSLVLFVTFDESDTQPSNRVPTIVIAPSVPRGTRVGVYFTHYSLLRTTESLLHVGFLGAARTASSMVGPFHL